MEGTIIQVQAVTAMAAGLMLAVEMAVAVAGTLAAVAMTRRLPMPRHQ